ncbi:MAG: DUF6174 domain-containing protein [Gemmatimonadota bacterium]
MALRTRRFPLVLVPLLVIAGSCDDSPTGTGLSDLSRARTLWSQNGFTDYDYTLTQSCFCGFVGQARVGVRDGAVVSVNSLETGEAIPVEFLRFRTVEGAFDLIQSFLNEQADRRVEVRFHDRLGYPVSGFLDIFQVADEELQFEIEDLEPAG